MSASPAAARTPVASPPAAPRALGTLVDAALVGSAAAVLGASLRADDLTAQPAGLYVLLLVAALAAAAAPIAFRGAGFTDPGLVMLYAAVFLLPARGAAAFALVANVAANLAFGQSRRQPLALRLRQSLANGAIHAWQFLAGGAWLAATGRAVPLAALEPADAWRLPVLVAVVQGTNLALRTVQVRAQGRPWRAWFGRPLAASHATEAALAPLGLVIALSYEGQPWHPTFVLAGVVFALGALAFGRHSQQVARLRERVARQGALQHLGALIGSRLRLDELLETLHRELRTLFEFDGFWLGQLRRRAERIEYLIAYEQGERQPAVTLPVRDGVPAWICQHGRALLCEDQAAARRQLGEGFAGPVPLSLLAVPLQVDDAVIGVLSMHRYRDGAYGREDLALLEGLAGQVVVALGNARLLQVLRDLSTDLERKVDARTRELRTIGEISREVAAILEVDRLLDRFADLGAGLTEAEVFAVRVIPDDVDASGAGEGHLAARGYADLDAIAGLRRTHRGIGALAMARRQSVIENDVTRAPDHLPVALACGRPARSELAVPLLRQDRALGVIVLESTRVDFFTEAHRDMLETLAGQIAVAVDNARLYQRTLRTLEDLRRAQAQLRLINEISREIAAILDVDQLLERVAARVREVVDTDVFAIFLRAPDPAPDDPDRCECRRAFGYDPSAVRQITFRVGQGIAGAAMQDRRTLLVNDLAADARHLPAPLASGDVARAELAVPLLIADRALGVLVMESVRPGFFTDAHRAMLEILAGQIAVALENAQLYQRTVGALEELRTTQAQLVRSESLAAIGQLVAGVAHELNNPIGAARSLVQSSMETLTEAAAGDAELLDDLRFATTQLDRAKGIVQSLLDVSRQTPTLGEAVDLNQAVRDAVTVLYNKYKHAPVQIAEALAESLPRFPGNFAQIAQVCLNIVQNAIQSLPELRGRVALRTGLAPAGAPGAPAAVWFECEDNGVGVAPEIRRDLFKPFFTTKEAGVGTGLGLYICHEIVKRHNGHIDFTSEPGAGTTFRVLFPTAGEAEDDGAAAAERNP